MSPNIDSLMIAEATNPVLVTNKKGAVAKNNFHDPNSGNNPNIASGNGNALIKAATKIAIINRFLFSNSDVNRFRIKNALKVAKA